MTNEHLVGLACDFADCGRPFTTGDAARNNIQIVPRSAHDSVIHGVCPSKRRLVE